MACSDSGKNAAGTAEQNSGDPGGGSPVPVQVPLDESGSSFCPSVKSEITEEINVPMIFEKLADMPKSLCFPAVANTGLIFGKPSTLPNPFSIFAGPTPVFGSTGTSTQAPPFSQSQQCKDPKNNASVIFGKPAALPTLESNLVVSTNPSSSSGPISQVVGPSKSSRKKARRKIALQQYKDPILEHGQQIDDLGKIIKCKYCEAVHMGGLFGHEHHLAGTKMYVNSCPKVPNDVRLKFSQFLGIPAQKNEEMKRTLDIREACGDKETHGSGKLTQKTKQKKRSLDTREACGNKETQVCGKLTLGLDSFVMSNKKQGTLNEYYKRQLHEDVCEQICRFFYTSNIPLNCVKNPEFSKTIEMIGLYGMGLKPPSYHEIKVTYLEKEVKRALDLLGEFKTEWNKLGCTVMLDSWTNGKKSMCNILVNSVKGTFFLSSIDTTEIDKSDQKVFEMLDQIVEMVGENNVVQVVTINTSNYEKAGKILMEKRKKLYWTPCAANCIDLMLEDFDKKFSVHKMTIAAGKRVTSFIYSRNKLVKWLREETKGKDLIRPAINRFAKAYLTLACLNEHKAALNNLFLSERWKSSKYAKLDEGKKVEQIVFDNRSFWLNVVTCLKGAIPLVKVLRLVDSDENPTMPFVYEGINRAKLDIQKNFNGVSLRYNPIWKIIDDWCNQLFQPLHATAYYLNPYFHYKPDFMPGPDVKKTYYDCLFRMVHDKEERNKIDLQFDLFHNAKGLFGLDLAVLTREKKSPVDWWESYGDDAPELKRFAIRILSLT